jgi:hypothetical protein
MGKIAMVLVAATVGMGLCGSARAEGKRPLLRVFQNGSGRVEDFDRVTMYEHVWETGVMPGATSHGVPVRDSGWTAHRQGELQVSSRTQVFADGTSIFREVSMDAGGHLVRVRFYDTHADGARQGFRLDGTLPNSVAFASPSLSGTMSAAR